MAPLLDMVKDPYILEFPRLSTIQVRNNYIAAIHKKEKSFSHGLLLFSPSTAEAAPLRFLYSIAYLSLPRFPPQEADKQRLLPPPEVP